jgi:hypothetical protein
MKLSRWWRKRKRGDESSIFDWARDRGGLLHITNFLLFSVLVHGAGFYLFQVTYPPPVRVEPTADVLTMLDGEDLEVRSLLQRVEDRTVVLRPPSEGTEVRVGLSEHQVRFEPTFLGSRPALPDGRREVLAQQVLAARFESPRPIAGLPVPPPVQVSCDALLAERKVAPWSLLEDYLRSVEGLPAFRAEVTVAPEGSVEVLQITPAFGQESESALRELIESTLRFVPGDEATMGWIEVTKVS